MEDNKVLVKLARDLYGNKFSHEKYSTNEANDVLQNKFIELNGGSTELNYKALRRNGPEMFEIIEQILENTVLEGLPDDSFFHQFVEDKNLARGDQNSFYIPDNTMLVVSEIADGTQALRRQRLDVGTNVPITTSRKGVKIYEHLDRLISGRVDFNKMLDAIEKAFRLKINDEIYDAFIGSFATMPHQSELIASGDFEESKLMDIVEHVEAASGKQALIAGTMGALSRVTTALISDSAKEDVYRMGHYGTFHGTPMVRLRQVHNVGTFTFKLDQNDIYIVTTDERPIKFVTEGEALIVTGDALDNMDLTQDYFFSTRYGVGVVITDEYGIYQIDKAI